MAEIGRRIYYELATGNVLADTGDRSGDVVPTTVDQDYELYTNLAGKNRDAIGILELAYGDHSNEFNLCTGYSVDPATRTLQFDYTPRNQDRLTLEQTVEEHTTKLTTQDEQIKAQSDAINFLLGV